jgi:hypothetical protein
MSSVPTNPALLMQMHQLQFALTVHTLIPERVGIVSDRAVWLGSAGHAEA